MLADERKRHLLDLLGRDGRVVAKRVSQDLGLSEDTIRRDLRALDRAGHLKRVHGGAIPVAAAQAPFSTRLGISTPEKEAIGAIAAQLVAPNQVLFLDGGTTALEVARHLSPDQPATVITHSPNVALALMPYPALTIELLGGRLFRHSVVTCGAATLAGVARLRPDLCIMGATGLHATAGITTGDAEEAEVKHAVIARSSVAYVTASSAKLGAISPFRLADWSDVDGVIVDPRSAERAAALVAGTDCTVVTDASGG